MKKITKNNHFDQIQALYDSTLQDTEKMLLPEFQRVYRETLTKLKGIYYEILEAKGDGTLLVSDLYRYDKYWKVLNELNEKIYKLGGDEKAVLEQSLIDLYQQNSRLIGSEFGVPPLSQERALKAINTIWCQADKSGNGFLWSDRIWGHTKNLAGMVEQGMLNTIVTGAGSKELAKQIQTAFGTTWYDSQRLARTELAHIMNQAAVDQYEQAGVEKYKVLVADGPCPICEELAKKEWKIDELVIPAHPNCRCCTIGVI